jgi:hypothetical protein
LKKLVRLLTLRQRRLKKLLEQGGKIEYVRLKCEPKPEQIAQPDKPSSQAASPLPNDRQ